MSDLERVKLREDMGWKTAIQYWKVRAEKAEKECYILRNSAYGIWDAAIEAANIYLTQQYGLSALGNPIDQARIKSIKRVGDKHE